MLDINKIRTDPGQIKTGIAAKNADPKLVDKFLELDGKWRNLNKQFDDLRAEQKKLGKDGKEKAGQLKSELKKIESDLNDLDKIRQELKRPKSKKEKTKKKRRKSHRQYSDSPFDFELPQIEIPRF